MTPGFRNILQRLGLRKFVDVDRSDFAQVKLYEPTSKQKQIQARVASILKERGVVTAWEILSLGTTDAHKVALRLKRLGVIGSTEWAPNADGKGRHKRYYANQAWRAAR